MTISHSHIVAHATMAWKDEMRKFSWVEFNPGFHLHLVKHAFSLLNVPITAPAQKIFKRAIFIFILELLNKEREDDFFNFKCSSAKENCATYKRKQLTHKSMHAPGQECTHKPSQSPEIPPSNPATLTDT